LSILARSPSKLLTFFEYVINSSMNPVILKVGVGAAGAGAWARASDATTPRRANAVETRTSVLLINRLLII
jgi:hypothetical protein